jgi:WD40 repeat protein
MVAGATHEWQIGIWEWPSCRLVRVLPAPVGRFVDSIGMAFDADGRRFACSDGHQARLWELQSDRLIKEWDLHEGLCDSLAFRSSERLLLVREETQTGRTGPFGPVDVRVDPRVVRIYDLLSSTPTNAIVEINDFPAHVHAISLTPNGAAFVVEGVAVDKDRQVVRRSRVYDGASGKLLRDLPSNIRPISATHTHFDPSGKVGRIVLDSGHGSLFGLPEFTFRKAPDVPIACLSPGAIWAMGNNQGTREIYLSEIATGRTVLRISEDVEASRFSFNFSPDGRHVIFGRKDGTISVLEPAEVNKRLSELHLGW